MTGEILLTVERLPRELSNVSFSVSRFMAPLFQTIKHSAALHLVFQFCFALVGPALIAPAVGVILPADYEVTTTGNTIVVTDISGNSDTLTISEPVSGTIQFTAAGRFFSVNGTLLADTSGPISLAGAHAITVNAESGNDTVTVEAFTASLPNLTLNGGTGDDVLNFDSALAFVPDANLDLDLQNDSAMPGVDRVNLATNARLVTAGSGAIILSVSESLGLLAGSRLETVNGNLTVSANQQSIPTAGSFVGVEVRGGIIQCTGTGIVSVAGTGGSTGPQQQGINIWESGRISGGSVGTVEITGTGGASAGNYNSGIHIQDVGSVITSEGANVRLIGTGGGSGLALSNVGIECSGGAQITAGGWGTVTLMGTGGVQTGSRNYGISVAGNTTAINSSGGQVEVIGTGGGTGGSAQNYGVFVTASGRIISGNSGNVTVTGQGGNSNGTGSSNYGVVVYQSGIITSSGNVSVLGTGGGANLGNNNYGIYILTRGQITSSPTGRVSVTGRGGNPTGDGGSNYGIFIYEPGSKISSNLGDLVVSGTGGGQAGSGSFNSGVFLSFSTGITSNGGNIMLTAKAGGGAGSSVNRGLQLQDASTISTSGGGAISLFGIGGGGTGNSHGLRIVFNASVTTVDGDIFLEGTALDGTGASQGYTLSNAAQTGAKVQTSGTGRIFVAADTIDISSNGVSMNAGTISLRPKTLGRAINLGSVSNTTPNTLELSDEELDALISQTVSIGNSESGPISISAPLSPFSYDTLALGQNTVFAATGSFTATVGPTATSFKKISVTGTVEIISGALFQTVSTGGYIWNGLETFNFLSNDGNDPIIGSFSGLVTSNFLGSSLTASPNYQGGSGNDFVIGQPLTALENWRQTWFGTTANGCPALDTAIPYGNGIPNLAAFAFFGPTANPALVQPGQLPQPQISNGTFFYQFTEPSGVSGVTYHAEWKDSLTAGAWQPIVDSGSVPQHIFSVPVSNRKQIFMRLKVTSP